MPPAMTEEQINEALLLSDAALAAAGHSRRDLDDEADIREALRGHMTFDEVIRRGVERIRSRG